MNHKTERTVNDIMRDKSFKEKFTKFYEKYWLLGYIGNGSFIALPMITAVIYYSALDWGMSLGEFLVIFSPVWFFLVSLSFIGGKLAIFATIIYWIWGLVFAFLAFADFMEGWFLYILFSLFAIYTIVYYIIDAN